MHAKPIIFVVFKPNPLNVAAVVAVAIRHLILSTSRSYIKPKLIVFNKKQLCKSFFSSSPWMDSTQPSFSKESPKESLDIIDCQVQRVPKCYCTFCHYICLYTVSFVLFFFWNPNFKIQPDKILCCSKCLRSVLNY
jgi:hypothetical protein